MPNKKKDFSSWSKDELIKRVAELEKRKKYGLVWDEEREPEKVVEACKTTLPVLEEIKAKEIQTNPSKPTHILIEGDNYHTLSVLNYTHPNAFDVIYIDPPYNTGARDWTYNNKFIDEKDSYRHSKWLSMMSKRLVLAKNLINPRSGVFIITIDEHEVHRLRMLVEQIFSGFYIQMITTVTNPKGVTQGRFSRVEEYAIYCFGPDAYVYDSDDNLLNPPDPTRKPRWKGLLRSGTDAERSDRKDMFYPVLINDKGAVVDTSVPLPFEQEPDINKKINGLSAAWPIRKDNTYGRWGVSYQTLRTLIKKGYVSAGKYDKNRKTYGISYISEPIRKLIESGDVNIVNYDKDHNVVDIEYVTDNNRIIKTVWHRTRHDAGAYGTDLINNILQGEGSFSFPKSIYSTKDAINAVLKDKKNALVLDYFAGSGTTLNAVNLMNAIDNGSRQCFLATNNEVSIADAKELKEKGFQPGDEDWENLGICRSVTWPRSKYTILGKRDDGSLLEGEYYTGLRTAQYKKRKYLHLQFTNALFLKTQSSRRQLGALLEGISQDSIKNASAFFIPEIGQGNSSILIDESSRDRWLDLLVGRDDITTFYMVISSKSEFLITKSLIDDLLGDFQLTEELTYPMQQGFDCNLRYFETKFVDAKQTDRNKERLTKHSVKMLCLRENTFDLVDESETIKIFKNLDKYTAILFDENQIPDLIIKISNYEKPINVYVFSLGDDDFTEIFSGLNAEVTVRSIPAAILRVYKRIFA